MPRQPLFPLAALVQVLAVSAWLTGCKCDCKSGAALELHALDASTPGTVQAMWQHPNEQEPRIVCVWTPTTAGTSGWSCTPAPTSVSDGGNTTRVLYDDATPSENWEVTLQGPSGSVTKTVQPSSDDPGEGWPTECICYDYTATLSSADLKSVGAILKP